MPEQVTTSDETKMFSCSVWMLKDDANVNSKASFSCII